jgi:hypothetical protein
VSSEQIREEAQKVNHPFELPQLNDLKAVASSVGKFEMSLVQFYHQAFDATTQFFASGLALIHLRPKQYATLFPPLVTMEKIYSLIDEGKFPVLEQLAPAFTYCIILSIIRYLLQNFLMVVSPRDVLSDSQSRSHSQSCIVIILIIASRRVVDADQERPIRSNQGS